MQTPVTGTPVLAASPRAVARPMRIPTNEPGPRPTAIRPTAPSRRPPSAARSTSASSAVECRGLPSAAEPEQLLVQDLAAARRADGGVRGRRVETDDRLAWAPAQPVTLKTKLPTRLPSTNQLTRCLPGMFEVILLT